MCATVMALGFVVSGQTVLAVDGDFDPTFGTDGKVLTDFDESTEIVFFSSIRRHTRWPRDWSSDVCSSDLVLVHGVEQARIGKAIVLVLGADALIPVGRAHAVIGPIDGVAGVVAAVGADDDAATLGEAQIGRASCRERVESGGVGGRRRRKR